MDIAVGWLGIWARLVEEIAEVTLIDDDYMPVLSKWFKEFLELPTIKEALPPRDKLLVLNKGFREMLMGGST